MSVIVPVYNSQKYLEQCVRSLLAQTYKPIEIILVNDGSLDCSGEICDQYAKENKDIKVIHQKKSGVNEARKKGLLYAKGIYIAFIDSDDWIEPDFFKIMMRSMIKESADMITSNLTLDMDKKLSIQNSTFEQGTYTQDEINRHILPSMVYDDISRKPGIFAYLWGKIYKRDKLLKSIVDLDTRLAYGEDGAIVFPLLAEINKLVIIDYAGYHYVQHDTSTTHNLSLDLFTNVYYLKEYLTMKFQKLGKYELVERQIQYFIRDLLFQIIKAKYDVDCGKILCIPPYEEIPKNSRLIVYGAGKAGREFVRLFLQNKYVEIVAWVDKNFEGEIYSYKIERPESIKYREFDYILLALTDEVIASDVRKYLCNLGISDKKIIWKEVNWG